ncbi:MAG TPA: UdgX family uracil-DNA binding protein [Candidatus Binatia bacterium]|nr:UdgX family uracil-DNA binding protein [Candidatus Binatia bacterium]
MPPERSLSALREAAQGCRGCDLWERATQAVFGEGPRGAAVMLVGEQPGNAEDLAGRPFVGPAGRLLDEALDAAGIDRKRVFVTNAVKHFKWEPRGKLRIHAKPNSREVAACRPWLEAEVSTVHPKLLIALGATAAQSILGPSFRVTRQRGMLLGSPFGRVVATVHPASILRAPDPESRQRENELFVADLRVAAAALRDLDPD